MVLPIPSLPTDTASVKRSEAAPKVAPVVMTDAQAVDPSVVRNMPPPVVDAGGGAGLRDAYQSPADLAAQQAQQNRFAAVIELARPDLTETAADATAATPTSADTLNSVLPEHGTRIMQQLAAAEADPAPAIAWPGTANLAAMGAPARAALATQLVATLSPDALANLPADLRSALALPDLQAMPPAQARIAQLQAQIALGALNGQAAPAGAPTGAQTAAQAAPTGANVSTVGTVSAAASAADRTLDAMLPPLAATPQAGIAVLQAELAASPLFALRNLLVQFLPAVGADTSAIDNFAGPPAASVGSDSAPPAAGAPAAAPTQGAAGAHAPLAPSALSGEAEIDAAGRAIRRELADTPSSASPTAAQTGTGGSSGTLSNTTAHDAAALRDLASRANQWLTRPGEVRDALKLLLHGQLAWQGQLSPGVWARITREDAWQADHQAPGGMVKGTTVQVELDLPHLGKVRVRGLQIADSVSVVVTPDAQAMPSFADAFANLQTRLEQIGVPRVRVALQPASGAEGSV